MNSEFSSQTLDSMSPSSKLSLNINAFNGNTTNFNRCPAPKSTTARQPLTNTSLSGNKPPMVVPM